MNGSGENGARWLVGIFVTLLGIAVGAAVPIYLANRDDGPSGGPGAIVTSNPDGARTPASIFLSKLSGPTGTKLNVTGEHFAANEEVRIRFHVTELARTKANAAGSFTVTVTVPGGYSDFAPKDFTIAATGRSSIKSGDATFKLTG